MNSPFRGPEDCCCCRPLKKLDLSVPPELLEQANHCKAIAKLVQVLPARPKGVEGQVPECQFTALSDVNALQHVDWISVVCDADGGVDLDPDSRLLASVWANGCCVWQRVGLACT